MTEPANDTAPEETTPLDAAAYWEGFYAARDTVWSGNPNTLTVAEAERLTPGTVLDLGCGEGGDAIWFARQGWQVTAVDVSATALGRVAGHAAEAGLSERVTVQRHDFGTSFPAGGWDLVSTAFLHSWPEYPLPTDLHARVAALVAVGGHLLIVTHGGFPTWRHDHPDIVFDSVDEVLAQVRSGGGQWDVVRAERITSPITSPEGEEGTRDDQVVHVRRLG